MAASCRPSGIVGFLTASVFLLSCGTAPVRAHEAAIAGVAAPAPADRPAPLAEPQAPRLRPAVPDPGTLSWGILLALAAFTTFRARRLRHAAAVALVALLVISAFESSLHSVHHLSEQGRLGQCPAACASQQVAGTVVETVAAAPLPAPVGAEIVRVAPATRAVRARDPHEGRAPPNPV